MPNLPGPVLEATERTLARITEYLCSFLNKSEDFLEPYISDNKTFLIPEHSNVWVLTQFNTPKFVNFAFRPLDELIERVMPEPVQGEFVNEPLLGFKVHGYFLASIRKATLVDTAHAELFFQEIKDLVRISLEQINRFPELYGAGFTDSADVLRQAQASGDRSILLATALNLNCPPDVVASLSKSHDPLILKAVACNAHLTPAQQLVLMSNPFLDHRGFCAIARRLTLDPVVRRRLEECAVPAVDSYLKGPRIVEHINQNSASAHLPATLKFFRHLLGHEYLEGVTNFNKPYFDYFSSHDHMDFADLISALQSQKLASKDAQTMLRHLFAEKFDKASLAKVTTRLANSIENAKRHRELHIRPFSFIIEYEYIWTLRWRRADMNFNVALEYAPELYYPEQISIADVDKKLRHQFFHLWNTLCWCSGRITEHEGKTVLFILELQCDLFRLSESHVTRHFRDWTEVLLNVAIFEARRRGVEAIYLLSSKALMALYGYLYGLTYKRWQELAWVQVYDGNAARLGMRSVQTTPVNIYPEDWNAFEWNEFYYAEIGDLATRELLDSRTESVKTLAVSQPGSW